MIYLISCGVSLESVSENTKNIIRNVKLIAGGKRLLKIFAEDNQEQILLDANLTQTLQTIIKYSDTEDVALLASGDALFHGIATTLAEASNKCEYLIIPNVTAFQALCAKIKQPWGDFNLFSIHGRKGVVPWRRILSSNEAIIYCDNVMPAHKLADKFIQKYSNVQYRKAISCENIGCQNEKINRGTLKELTTIETGGLSILMLLQPDTAEVFPPLPLALDDKHYKHENNLITHPETRAVILSKLRLHNGIMWDLGAGSGSVGLEAAGLSPALTVYAVEKSPERCRDIIENKNAEGLINYHLTENSILKEISKLPPPDIVFIGGGGADIGEIVLNSFNKLKPKGRIVVSAVTLETVATLNSILKNEISEVLTISISRSKSVGSLTLMKSENQITLFIFEST